MSPVRAPDVVSGSLPDLWRGTPTKRVCSKCGSGNIRLSCSYCGDSSFDHKCNDGCRECGGADVATIDWSDRAAIYLCLAWLADRGFSCLWMLPTTHGGRVEAWDGLTAWEVSAIVVARSVGRVGRGLGPVKHLLSAYGPEELFGHDGPEPHQARRVIGGVRRIGPMRVASVGPAGWFYDRAVLPRGANVQCDDWARGPETGDAGKLAADRAALADGCALLSPGGVALPDLGAEHE